VLVSYEDRKYRTLRRIWLVELFCSYVICIDSDYTEYRTLRENLMSHSGELLRSVGVLCL
jgi:hypothetical protein